MTTVTTERVRLSEARAWLGIQQEAAKIEQAISHVVSSKDDLERSIWNAAIKGYSYMLGTYIDDVQSYRDDERQQPFDYAPEHIEPYKTEQDGER